MHPIRLFAVFIALFAACCTSSIATAAQGKVLGAHHFDIPGWFKQSFLEISEDAAEAGDDNKHVMLFFHLDACPYCDQLLDDNFRGSDNQSNVEPRFDAIEINIKGDREVVFNEQLTLTEKNLAQKLGVQYTPTVLFVTPDNKVALRINGYRSRPEFQQAMNYVSDRAYSTLKFEDYLQANAGRAPYTLRSHQAFQQNQQLDRAAQTPLAIVFEDPSCLACEDFHNTLLQRDDVSAVLNDLTVVRLDTSSKETITTVDGQTMTPGEWARALDLQVRPAVVLFDKGKEVVRIDALLGSWHFKGIVQWVAGRHYNDYPNMYEYIATLEKAALERGENVDYRD